MSLFFNVSLLTVVTCHHVPQDDFHVYSNQYSAKYCVTHGVFAPFCKELLTKKEHRTCAKTASLMPGVKDYVNQAARCVSTNTILYKIGDQIAIALAPQSHGSNTTLDLNGPFSSSRSNGHGVDVIND